MRLPRTGEKGFTLVELLIVLAILAVLSAVVLFNVTNTFRRAAEQAYYTDQKTIQQIVALFYFDPHAGPMHPAGKRPPGASPCPKRRTGAEGAGCTGS